jgi:negative regulator of flagellin synthesis FlgM
MPIDGINDNGKVGPIHLAKSQAHRSNGNHGEAAATRQPDNVQISDRTEELLRIRRLVDALPEVRLDRVNALAKAIDEGNYNVKGEQIAEAIIQKHLIDLKG